MSKSRKDTALMILIVLLVAFAGYHFGIAPQRSDLADVRADRVAVELTIVDVEAALRDLESSGGQPSPDTEAANLAVPPTVELPEFLRRLQAIGETTGVAQLSVSPGVVDVNPTGPGGSLQLTITGTGSHEAVRAYLDMLRDMERLVVIEEIGLDMPPEGAKDNLQVSIRVFTQEQPALPAAGS